jgi:hypothetical protein
MSPRIAAFARLLVVAFLIILAPLAAHAQSCTPPVVTQIGGMNPSCAGAAVTLDAGDGWVTYAWSNGATTRSITDAPMSTTAYSVTTTDALGCSVTSAPLEITVNANLAPPEIELYEPEICPGSSSMNGYAMTVEPPPGTQYVAYQWTITNGTFPYGSTSSSVSFQATGDEAVELGLTVTDQNGCQASTGVTVPIRIIPPPVIELYEPEICPGSNAMGGYAMTAPPPQGVQYMSYEWTIVNGTLPYGNTGSSVSFTANGNAPVELTLQVTENHGCTSTASVTVPIRTIPPPVIQLYEPEICPGSSAMGGYAMTAPPPPGVQYMSYEWTIVNGTLPYGNTGSSVSFTANGNAPVELTLKVTENRGCTSTASVTVPIRTIPPPVIQLYEPSICPGSSAMSGYAMTAPPPPGVQYMSYEWTIVNGTLPYGNTGSSVSFTANGNAPVQLTLKVTENRGCTSTASVSVPIRSIPPPEINLYEPTICPNSPMGGYAMAAPPPSGIQYSSYEWSIVNGTLPYGNTGSSVGFTANGNGPVALTLKVTENRGCQSTKSITVPLGLGTPPQITMWNPSICNTEPHQATVNGTYATYDWSVSGGTVLSGQGTNEIQFAGDGSGPVTLTVTAANAEGCAGTGSFFVPLIAYPVSIYAPPTACLGGLQKASLPVTPPYTEAVWTATNATIEPDGEGAVDSHVLFRANGNGPVTLHVTAIDYNGCRTQNSVTIPLGPMPVPEIGVSYATICPLGYSSAYVQDLYPSYEWVVTNVVGLSGQGTPSIQFDHLPDAGDVTVTLNVGDGACATSVTRIIEVRDAVEPVMELATPAVCPNGNGTIWFDNYDSFSYVSIYVTNGTYIGNGAGRVTGGRAIQFRSNGTGDVTVLAMADSNSCNQQKTFTIPTIATPVPTITPSGPTTFCAGGSVTLTASPASSYLWSNGATTPSITVTQSAGINVTTTSAAGCARTSATILVTVRPLPNATISASGPTTFCAGGSVTLSVPTQSGATYAWSNGATTSSINVSTAGSYSVTVMSSFGCSLTSTTVPVTVNPLPAAGIHSTQIYDDGGSGTMTRNGDTIEACGNPTIRLVAQALDPSFTYNWSNGATTAVVDVTTSATYTLTVTTPSGCATTSSVVVHYGAIPPKPTIAAPQTELCPAGGSVTLTAPNADAWSWSNGATTQSILVTEPGSYRVSVRVGACTSQLSDPVIVTTGMSTITTNDSLALCDASSSATLTANDGTSWLWSNGATTRSIVVTEAGSYRVTTTNAGCTMPESSPVIITARSLSIDASGPTSFCEGSSVTLIATSGASWLWTNGATTQSITVSTSGSYGVTASFGDGCSIVAAPVNVEARHVTVGVTADAATVCTGGPIHLQALAAGSAGYTYQWYDNTYTPIAGATSSTLTINPTTSGFVYVKVHDELGCEATSSGTIYTVVPTPNATITAAAALCEGQTGSASVADAGAGATYSWTITNGTLSFPNAPSVTFTPNSAGTVTLSVTITNAGCSVSSSKNVTINATPTPSISASGPTTFCQGGSVTLTGQGGSGTWYRDGTPLSAQPSITVNTLGTASYIYRIVSAAGCQVDSAPVTVTVNAKPVITTSGGNASACWNSTSSYEVANQPAGTTYSWSLTNATIVSGQTNSRVYYQPTADATSVGFDVVVTNTAGCSATAHYDIPVDRAAATIDVSGPTTFCTGGSVTLSMPTAPAGWAYFWSNNASTQSITVSSSGTYTARYLKLAGSCVGPASDPVTVTVNARPVATITPSGSTTFCAGNSVTFTASAGSSYLWSTGETSPSISVNASGSYSVTVTNASGCSTTSSPTNVTVNPLPTATITPSGATTFCAGGSVTLTASAGSSYLWSTGATSPSINVSTSGNYSVTVTNASGCSATSSSTNVTVNPLPTATITPSGATTFCTGGSVTLTASAGASYLWSTGATSPSINVSTAGNYTVTVTNANGCSATSSATTVTVNATPTATITESGSLTFCAGGSVTLTASAGASYLWSTGATSPSINVTTSGNYTVMVTNASGCSATSPAKSVTVNATPTATITESGPLTFCTGGSVTLTASAGASYLWSTGATSPSINVTTSGNYTVIVTNTNGCSATSPAKTVSVNAAPTATITESGPLTFCTGGSVTLTASAGASYLWSTGATSPSINVTTSGNYTVIVTNASGCSATSPAKTVTVNAAPTATITESGPLTFCTGGSVTLTASAGASYLWSTGATSPSINVTTTGNYTVTVTNANGCSAMSAPKSVTVNAVPATPVISAGGPTTFCAGGSVTLTAPAGYSYLWSTGAITQSIVVSATNNYTVTVTNAGGCSAISAPTSVTVNAATSITQQPQNATIPRNTTTQLSVTATGTGTLTYQWYRGTSPSTATPISGATSSTYTTPKLTKGTYTYWVKVTGTCGVANSVTATISVP